MKQKTAYQIDPKFLDLLSLVESIPPGDVCSFNIDALQMTGDKKARQSGFTIKEAKAQINLIKSRIEKLAQQAARYEGLISSIKNWVSSVLKVTGKDRLTFDEFEFYLRQSQPELIIDDSKLAEVFSVVVDGTPVNHQIIKTKTSKSPDRALIKKLLAQGNEIEGAHTEDVAPTLVFD